jgi:NADPH:quinone reductase-like Zn-dependent oxidoreductase
MTTLPATSRAVVLDQFGEASHLKVREVATPRLVSEDQLLVRVHATSINPIEWKMRAGMGLPHWIWRLAIGTPMVLGIDFAGTVVAAGQQAGGYKVGDEVMGALPLAGTYAEYVVVEPNNRRTALAKKPPDVSFEQAALVPFAGLVAYAGLVTHGPLHPPASGARVLIIGASGGVGHLAVQMAKHGLGAAHVVAVTSSRNASFVRGLGADQVVAYDQVPVEAMASVHSDWAHSFDLIFDTVGVDAYYRVVARRLLKPSGRFVSAALPQLTPGQAAEDVGAWGGLRLLGTLASRRLRGRYSLITGLLAGLPSKEGFPRIVSWLAEGKVKPHLAALYDLGTISEAHQAIETGRTVGKIGVRAAAG